MRNIARSTKAEIAHSELGWLATWLMQTIMETPTTDDGVQSVIAELSETLKEIAQPYKRRSRIRKGA
ncbi:MAG: hypothetical protein ACXWPI_15855 [Ktedonobacterales bacterium]